jgi:hypothetical protein
MVLRYMKRNPETERFATDGVFSKSDGELLALMNAFGVCRQCAHKAVALFKTYNAHPALFGTLTTPDEAVGISTCSDACCKGIIAAISAQQH